MSRSWTHRIKERLNGREFAPQAADRDALSRLLDAQFPAAPAAEAAQSFWTQGAWLGGLSVVLMFLAPSDALQTPKRPVPAVFQTLTTSETPIENRPSAAENPTEISNQPNAEPFEITAENPDAPARALVEKTGPLNRSGSEQRTTAPSQSWVASEAAAVLPGAMSAQGPSQVRSNAASSSMPAIPSVLSPYTNAKSVSDDPSSTGVQKTLSTADFNPESPVEQGLSAESYTVSDEPIAPRSLSLPLPEQPQTLRQQNDWDLGRKPQLQWGPDAFGLSVCPGVSQGWEAQGLVHWNRPNYRWGTGLGLGQTGAIQKRSENYTYWETESRQEWETTTEYLPQIDSTWRILGINQGGWDVDTTYIAVVDSNWITVVDSTQLQGTAQTNHRRTGQLFEWPVYGERVWSQGHWEYTAGLGMGLGLLRLDAEPELGLPTQDIFRTTLELRFGIDWRWNEHASVGVGWNPRQVWYADPDYDPTTDFRALRLRLVWRW